MDQVIPRMHTIMGNNAKYKQFATPMDMRLSIQKLEECRGDVEETEAMSSKPWQPQGGTENPRSPREAWKAVGRPGSWEGSSIWKHSGMASSDLKKLKKHEKTEKT